MADYSVGYSFGTWRVYRHGAKRASKRFYTERDAILYARGLRSRAGGKIYVHNHDGTIRKVIQ